MVLRSGFVGIVLVCLLAGSAWPALQAQAQNVSDGVYTGQQAARGRTIYQERCASCHATTLGGRVGPPLAGDDFLGNWDTRPLSELANKIRNTMPKDETERLAPQQAADVLAYILQAGKFPSGRAELVMDEAVLKRVTFPVRASQPKPPAVEAQLQALPASGNVAQVMRGILFPSANILFTVQSIDPAAKKPAPKDDAPSGGFDWLTWGGGVYRGWEVVDYAAVSVAESAQLMLTPGRRCENGRLVPVTDPDWIKFSLELAEAGKAAYKASQTRSQEIASDATNQLNESCMNCHRVFRGRTHCAKP
jgi:mono/diheme cytochrome c family protein